MCRVRSHSFCTRSTTHGHPRTVRNGKSTLRTKSGVLSTTAYGFTRRSSDQTAPIARNRARRHMAGAVSPATAGADLRSSSRRPEPCGGRNRLPRAEAQGADRALIALGTGPASLDAEQFAGCIRLHGLQAWRGLPEAEHRRRRRVRPPPCRAHARHVSSLLAPKEAVNG